MNTLIVGTGKLGQRFYNYLVSKGEQPYTLSRSEKSWASRHIVCDLLKVSNTLPELPQFSNVYIILAPDERAEPAYRQTYIHAVSRLIQELHKQQTEFHCTFLSSTSVYEGNLEPVIDESVTPKPANFKGKALLDAEKSLQTLHPVTSIVRASGLYSSDRSKLMDSLLDKDKYHDPKWLNLIHEDDLCYWLELAGKREMSLSIASDGTAFTRQQLQDHVAGKEVTSATPSKQYHSVLLKRLHLQFNSIFDWFDKTNS
ncbi:sugar nucleotide-binding protein [Kangiella marina]|uniref:RmlD-like substrate binding domain-containing protein n=1 Tax=Kangiella marina TaxID=1079178 RepID=A0ABP8IJY0_9GAMM